MKNVPRIIIIISFISFLSTVLSCKKAPSGTGSSSFSKFQIIADDNLDSLYSGFGPNTHNGQVNLAEEVQFKVFIKNSGSGPAKNVKATIIAPVHLYSSDIYDFRTTKTDTGGSDMADITFGDISSGSEKACNETLFFDVERYGIAHDYDRLKFELNITADGYSAIDTFSMEIMHFTPQYNFQMLPYTITKPSDSVIHQRNGFGFTVNFRIKNTGNSCASSISATTNPPKFFEEITIPGSSISFGNVLPKSQASSSPVLFTLYGADINKPIPLGKVQDTLFVNDEFYNTWTLPYSYNVVP